MQKHPPGEKVTTGDHARKNAPKSRPALGEKTPERNRPMPQRSSRVGTGEDVHFASCVGCSSKGWNMVAIWMCALLAFDREEGNCVGIVGELQELGWALDTHTRYRIVLSPT